MAFFTFEQGFIPIVAQMFYLLTQPVKNAIGNYTIRGKGFNGVDFVANANNKIHPIEAFPFSESGQTGYHFCVPIKSRCWIASVGYNKNYLLHQEAPIGSKTAQASHHRLDHV
jgi:hypothetical protein